MRGHESTVICMLCCMFGIVRFVEYLVLSYEGVGTIRTEDSCAVYRAQYSVVVLRPISSWIESDGRVVDE